MDLIDSLQDWLGQRSSRAGAGVCPLESDILNYTENRLSAGRRARLNQHFATCQDCRELLVLLARFPEAEIAEQPPLSNAEIQQQTARVLQLAEQNGGRKSAPAPRLTWAYRFRVPLAAAMVLVCALLVGGIYLMTRSESASESARRSLAAAMKDERRSAARLSGGFDYSPYVSTTRGADDESPDLKLNLALSQLRSAEAENAPAEMRQMLARAYLAFDRSDYAQQAEAILESLRARNVQTAELFNDLGVAQYQLQKFDAAASSFGRALEINPTYSEALFNRALTMESAGRDADAQRDWEQFLTSTHDAKWQAEAEHHLGGLSGHDR
jgi:tetratricopeptide (TPR) repeat protein